MIGRNEANRIIREHGSNDLREIMQAESVSVMRLDFGGARFREFYVNGVIFLPLETESEAEERSSLAHALGHHLLHVGNQVWMRGLDNMWSWKQERQAEEFAAWFLIPESEDARPRRTLHLRNLRRLQRRRPHSPTPRRRMAPGAARIIKDAR